jgi:cysteinyl-tRNA synthetase
VTLGIEVLITDYCSTQVLVDDSYAQAAARDYLSFAADSRELVTGPAWLNVARNFLYLINPAQYAAAADFVAALDATDFDVFIIDVFFDGDQPLTPAHIAELQTKPGGAQRLVIAYMSIGEAEDYRFYWQDGWKRGSPEWLEAENASWGGNYVVRYWDPDWKSIISGTADSYLDRIIAAGFDGVYLDIIDAYEYFEDRYE